MFSSNYRRGSSGFLLSVADSFETIRIFSDTRKLRRRDS
jgi:hypothetical protein